MPFSTLELIVGEKRLVGSVQHHYDEDLPIAVQLLAEGKVRVAPLISDRVPLEHVVEDGLQALAQRPEERVCDIVWWCQWARGGPFIGPAARPAAAR